ncbi:MAG: hypothetical protein L6428_03905 [Candidatus Aminicenantes bacterium]|nr:hypothetical protein [Acidobacteriota bacterium]MCG2810590.1 hypothetical protein [Candidatus Aminicenantes bacterium]
MIKKQQKWIALLVTLTFMGLLQVSTMPVAAANTTEQIASANAEQAPSFIEEEGDSSYQPKKKSILPVILIGVGVAAVAAVLVLVVFKTKYDIVGTWDFSFTSASPAHTWTWSLLFKGDKKSGTFVDEFNDKGTYKVDNKDVTIEYDEWDIKITGKFDNKDKMSGSATFSDLTIGGKDVTSATWIATRQTSGTASLPKTTVIKPTSSQKAKKHGF